MATQYATTHAQAVADVKAAGLAVTFTRTAGGTYNRLTDTTTGSTTTTVTGWAVRVPGSPITYERLNLVQSEAPTLLFAPTTVGTLPPLSAQVNWGGVSYTVRDVDPIAPDGVALVARVVVAR